MKDIHKKRPVYRAMLRAYIQSLTRAEIVAEELCAALAVAHNETEVKERALGFYNAHRQCSNDFVRFFISCCEATDAGSVAATMAKCQAELDQALCEVAAHE
jgi:hypothetical protein